MRDTCINGRPVREAPRRVVLRALEILMEGNFDLLPGSEPEELPWQILRLQIELTIRALLQEQH